MTTFAARPRCFGYALKCSLFVAALLTSLASAPIRAAAETRSVEVETVKAVLRQPESKLDFLAAAAVFDRAMDKGSDTSAARATVARLVDAARQMAGPKPSDRYKLAAVRKAIYGAGAWNYNRPFTYDLADPLGLQVKSKMLSSYVRTRKGNCVSMPVLFLIVADRMGLKVRLAAAPLHLFVRYTDPAGVDHNLEATSGGLEASMDHYRSNLPMTERALQSGIYMRTLSRRETVAAMAISVVEALTGQGRYQEAIDTADAILAVNPRDAHVLALKGNALGEILKAEYHDKYPDTASVPPALRPRYAMLATANKEAFRDAEALGWEPGR